MGDKGGVIIVSKIGMNLVLKNKCLLGTVSSNKSIETIISQQKHSAFQLSGLTIM